jgi:hypothetical protein
VYEASWASFLLMATGSTIIDPTRAELAVGHVHNRIVASWAARPARMAQKAQTHLHGHVSPSELRNRNVRICQGTRLQAFLNSTSILNYFAAV